MTLADLNALSSAAAEAAFLRCCGATQWARQMTSRRSFADLDALFTAADEIWAGLSPDDWLQAFAHHPRIGDAAGLRTRIRGTRITGTRSWAAAEQAGAAGASDAMLRALAEGNRLYEERFGYLFVVCASGKGADEMLEDLRTRLGNAPTIELPIAAEEQRKITRLRLEKALQE